MELDWYSKKQFSSCSARRVATLTNFMGHVGARLLLMKLPLVKPLMLVKRISSSVSTVRTPSHHDDFLLDYQPTCLSLGRLFSHFDMGLQSKHYHVTCYACVLHI